MIRPRVKSFVATYAAYVLFLHAVDGPWRRWKKGRQRPAVDPWTLQHLGWGAIARAWGLTREEFFALGLANEAVELATRIARPDLLWGSPESLPNVAVDIAANAAGFELAGLVLV